MSDQQPLLRTLPTGTITFLFTDIEGSTELLQRVGDEPYGDILERHHRLVRECFTPRGGYEIDTQGDAFFVAFPDATSAVATSIAAQLAITAHVWPDADRSACAWGCTRANPPWGPADTSA